MGKTYASSDWHGNLNTAVAALNYLNNDDILYYLGDAIDRGKYGMEIIDMLRNRPNTIFLKGNHEDLMYHGCKSRLDTKLWIEDNGGYATLLSLSKKTKEQQEEYLNWIKNLPVNFQYVNKNNQNIMLSHSGFNPWKRPYFADDFIWDREHMNGCWSSKKEWENVYVVHGHTPTPLMKPKYGSTQKDPCVVKYQNGHKINIDLGTVWTNLTCLLDLDTLEPIYIKGEK